MSEPLPSSRVLSYLARADSPTRVRRVSSWAMAIQALVYSLAGLAIAYTAYESIADQFTLADLMHAVTQTATLERIIRQILFEVPTIPALVLLAGATTMWLTVLPLRRGRRWAARLAFPIVLLNMAILVFASAIAGTLFIMTAGPKNDIRYSVWILVLVVSALLAATCIDVLSFLRWIVRQKEGEAPKRKFIG